MVALSRCLCSLALFAAGTEGGRISRQRGSASTKFIAGVPVLNYHTRKGSGTASLAELEEAEQDWIVMVEPGTSQAQIQKMCAANKKGCKLTGHPDGGVPFIDVQGTEKDLEVVLQSGGSAVQYAEPDGEVHMIPEIEGEVGTEAATWGLNKIGADQRAGSGSNTYIFVLDTGVRVSHQEFGGRAVPYLDQSVGNGQFCNGDTSCAGDVQGHGTHCAGTTAGSTVGVAPGATVASVKVLSDQGSGSWSWSYSALDTLATNSMRPAVASMSLGGSGTQQAMADAVNSAVNAGVVVVVAAGNDNSNACNFSPAFVPSAITVGSTDSNDRRSSFSNYGSCVDIWAPGSSVYSAGVSGNSAYSTLSGTSMACPHVSGGAALVLGANPSMRASDVVSELSASALKGKISGLTGSDTNTFLYVGAGGGSPTPTPTPPSPTPPSPTPPTGGCVHETDCSVSAWCNAPGYDTWCRQQGQNGSCPAPMCKQA